MFKFILLFVLITNLVSLIGKPQFLNLNKGNVNRGSVSKIVSISQSDIICINGGVRQGFQTGVVASVLNDHAEMFANIIVVSTNSHSSIALIIEKNPEQNISIGDNVVIKLL